MRSSGKPRIRPRSSGTAARRRFYRAGPVLGMWAKRGRGGARVAGSDSTGSPARAREVGGDPDRRAPPIGGLREAKAGTGWAGGKEKVTGQRWGFGPREGKGKGE